MVSNRDPVFDVREQLLDQVVDWIQAVFGWSDEEIGQKAMMEERGPTKGPGPSLPFLTYNLTLTDLPNGMEELVQKDNGYAITGGRRAVLSMTGIGEGAEELLTRLGLAADPRIIPGTIAILNLSPVLDISEFDETYVEPRYVKDFTILYRITTTEAVIPITQATTVLLNGEEFTP